MADDPLLTDIVLDDSHQPCPYLPAETACLPLRQPARPVTGNQLDRCLSEGDRRSGTFLYRTACPHCCACEPIRLPVDGFIPSRTQRRIWKRGRREIRVEYGVPQVDQARVDLFNRHGQQRGLAMAGTAVNLGSYARFLVASCCETVEFRYRIGGELIAVAICDVGQISVSAVYCYFDPCFGRYSPGTFSILNQIDFCRDWGKRYLYLGYYIFNSLHMSYKAKFRPHERRIGHRWRSFDRTANESATVRFSTAPVESET